MSSSRTGCLRFRADAALCSLCSPCFRPTDVSRARRRFALFCAAFAAEPEVSSGWALPVVERGRGLGSLRLLVRYPDACASVNANLCSGAPLCAGTAVPRQRPTGAVRSDPRGSANRERRRRRRGRPFSGSRDRRLRSATNGSGYRSSEREREQGAAPSRQIFYIQVVRPDLRDATPGRAMRLATPSRRKAAFSGALRRTR